MKKELIDLLVDNALAQKDNENLKKLTKDLLTNGKKKWYLSKTLWLNIVSVIALLIQYRYGFVIPAEEQLIIVGFANIILRAITGQELVK